MKPDWLIQEEARNLLVDFRRRHPRGFYDSRVSEFDRARIWSERNKSSLAAIQAKHDSSRDSNREAILESAAKGLPFTPWVVAREVLSLTCGNHDFGGVSLFDRRLIVANCPYCRAVKAGLDVSLVSQVVGKV